MLGGQHHAHRQQEQTLWAWLLKAHCLGSNADSFGHSTLALCRDTRAAGQTEQPWREGAMWVAWGGKVEANLGHGNKPRADIGSTRILHRDFGGCRGKIPDQAVSSGLGRACASCGDRGTAGLMARAVAQPLLLALLSTVSARQDHDRARRDYCLQKGDNTSPLCQGLISSTAGAFLQQRSAGTQEFLHSTAGPGMARKPGLQPRFQSNVPTPGQQIPPSSGQWAPATKQIF